MRRWKKLLRVAALAALVASPAARAAAEQGSPPGPAAAGTWAAGFEVGFSDPLGGSEFETEILFGGFLEFTRRERLSWRGALSYLAYDGPQRAGGRDDVDLLALNGNAVYRWPVGGMVRPYVTGGLGLYRYDPSVGGSGTDLGADFGGGADFLLLGSSSRKTRIAIRAEGLFHGTSGREPDSFFNGTVGVKFLF